MRAMDVGVEAAASPQCMVPLQARLELVNAIGQLNVSLLCCRALDHCTLYIFRHVWLCAEVCGCGLHVRAELS